MFDRFGDEALGVSIHVVCDLLAGAEPCRRGETISTMDLLIATAAVIDGAPLVSRNAREFERVPGLHVLSY